MRGWNLKFTPENPVFDIKHNLGTIDTIIKVSNRDGWPIPFGYTFLNKNEIRISLQDESVDFCNVEVLVV